MLVFKFDPVKKLKEHGHTSYVLQRKKILGGGMLNKLKQGYVPSSKTLDTLCELLEMQPGDMIEYVEDEKFYILRDAGYYSKLGIPIPENDTPTFKDK